MDKKDAPENLYWYIDIKAPTPQINFISRDYFKPKDKQFFLLQVADPLENLCGVYLKSAQKPKKTDRLSSSNVEKKKKKSPSKSPYKNPRLMTSVSVERKAKEFNEKIKPKPNKNFKDPQRKSLLHKPETNAPERGKSKNKSIKESKNQSPHQKAYKKSKTLF